MYHVTLIEKFERRVDVCAEQRKEAALLLATLYGSEALPLYRCVLRGFQLFTDSFHGSTAQHMLYSCCKSLSLLEIYNNNFWTEGLSRETLRLMENESYKTETPPSNWRSRRVGWKKISWGL